jgi:tRNA nucleotidyltransferase (CCA-adding enzyme)
VDDNGVIIGIVTRTDLIKLWDESVPPDRRSREMERRLSKTLSTMQHSLLRLIGSEVHALDFTVYVVGGFVRDLLLVTELAQFDSLDLDIVIEGDGIAFARHMCTTYGGRMVPHKQFGTAKWLLNDPDAPPRLEVLSAALGVDVTQSDLPPHLDFVSARTEFYTAPTVLPTVESGSIKLDLHRRDFTINTLALCLNPDRWGQLLDFYGGLADLRAGLVRALHSLSFVDDPTRILRAVRYEQRFGFQIEARSLELLADAMDLLDRVTPARLRHELERMLQEPDPERYLARLDALDVLTRIHPALHVDAWVTHSMQRVRAAYRSAAHALLRTEPLARLYWAILAWPLDDQANAALTERLGLRQATQRLVDSVRTLRAAQAQLADPALHPGDAVDLLSGATEADIDLFGLLCDDAHVQQVLAAYLTTWRYVQPEMDGNDLKALGVPRGPIYRRLLRALRAGRLDGTITSRADEEAVVRRLWEA